MKKRFLIDGREIVAESTRRTAMVTYGGEAKERTMWRGDDGRNYVFTSGKWFDTQDVSVRTHEQLAIANSSPDMSILPAGSVVVQCYCERIVFQNRKAAMAFYLEAMDNSYGGESDRYWEIYRQLICGRSFCSDGSEFHGLMLTFEVFQDEDLHYQAIMDNRRKWKELQNA